MYRLPTISIRKHLQSMPASNLLRQSFALWILLSMRNSRSEKRRVGKECRCLLLRSACIVCQQYQSASICNQCLQAIYHDSLLHYECCYQCGIPLQSIEVSQHQCNLCITQAPSFDQTICLDRYDGLLQEALHQFKYQKRLAFALGMHYLQMK